VISQRLFKRFYSDPRFNGTERFFNLIRRKAQPCARVLNLGAGPATKNPTCSLKGEVAEVVGADIDAAVLANDELDSAVVIDDNRLPFPDESFDLVFSDYVLEHVEHPGIFLSEVHRVLNAGSSFFFRTPNIYHYVAVISRVTPHAFHEAIANRIRGLSAEAYDPYPTFYRLNSRPAIREAAATAGFRTIDLQMVECWPSYLVFHSVPFLIGVAYERLVNSSEAYSGLRANIFGQLIK
jgi:SAM-dependent methyltransferase